MQRKLIVSSVATLSLLTGCFSMPWDRLGNQGGSNIVSALGKLVDDNLGGLNPDDVQVLTDLAIEYSGVNIPSVTDEQAAAVVSFLQANGITTIASLEDLIRRAEQDPDSVIIPDDVRQVLEAIAADPSAYIDAIEAAQL